ncbi:hypothetical protein ACEQ8H_005549 [Pleosporales sp. CAS-2024a]
MPRQLPWLSNGGGGKVQAKQPPRPRAASKVPLDDEDDLSYRKVQPSTNKCKERAGQSDDSEDDLPGPWAPSSSTCDTPRTTRDGRKQRAISSSPRPIAQDIQPQVVEYMRKGVSRFDLRDDEWMMVEDEFLETAKLFTRHLHIAEYERLKQSIEAKKRDQVQVTRPVMEKPPVQATRHDTDTDTDTDTDHLDSSHPSRQPPSRLLPAKPPPACASAAGPKSSALPHAPTHNYPATTTTTLPPSFVKPAVPAPQQQKRLARKSRFHIDLLDDYYVPPAHPAHQDMVHPPAPVPTQRVYDDAIHAPVPSAPRPWPVKRPVSPLDKAASEDDARSSGSGLSRATAERLAKRKAEREKERKKKSVKLDDIPTFLV